MGGARDRRAAVGQAHGKTDQRKLDDGKSRLDQQETGDRVHWLFRRDGQAIKRSKQQANDGAKTHAFPPPCAVSGNSGIEPGQDAALDEYRAETKGDDYALPVYLQVGVIIMDDDQMP